MASRPRVTSRRAFVRLAGGSALLTLANARLPGEASAGARLATAPRAPHLTIETGLHPLGLSLSGRDGHIYVPASVSSEEPVPLLVALHGATQAGTSMITRVSGLADVLGCALLAPDSRGTTWDGIRGAFGDDPAFIGRAMNWTFDRMRIDPERIWLCGFSDGASYALSLGLANGDRVHRVLAFSPGFVIPAERHGRPPIFVSHGRQDTVLPIDRCSRRIVPELRRDGYDVRFDEFEGGHRLTPEILDAAAGWLKG